jgi:hypothetical protein
MSEIPQKKERKGVMTLDPEDFYPAAADLFPLDLKPFLFRELIVKEDWFREQVEAYDWSACQNKVVCVFSSVDAIFPSWVYMIIASRISGVARAIYFEKPEKGAINQWLKNLENADLSVYTDARVIIKGCGKYPSSPDVYFILARRLTPLVRSLQFGEPCSTVPVYKKEIP